MAVLIAGVEYPMLRALPGGPWLVADASCPASLKALHDIRDSPALRASVLIVPAELEVAPVRESACKLLNQQLTERGHWLRLLPDELICNLVTKEAAVFRATNFVASPAWVYDMTPLPASTSLHSLLFLDQDHP